MTHEQKMKALIEAGGTLAGGEVCSGAWANNSGHRLVEHDETSLFATFEDQDEAQFYINARRARDTIALAAEGMRLLAELSDSYNGDNAGLTIDAVIAANRERWQRIDALLAKWAKETG